MPGKKVFRVVVVSFTGYASGTIVELNQPLMVPISSHELKNASME
jgi:hypothetical protein